MINTNEKRGNAFYYLDSMVVLNKIINFKTSMYITGQERYISSLQQVCKLIFIQVKLECFHDKIL